MTPHNDIQSVVQPPLQHQVVAAAAGSSPAILPNLLSWQMSQSFNTYPWRMQATGVPFFTFPSTPPSFIPANSYPYTFAPLPAAPFSISPMQPVPSSVHMPSYNGLSVMVPQVTTVDTNAPLNPNQGNVMTQGYAVAAPTAAVPSQPVLDRELQAVAVTLSGEGNPVLHVLQPHTTPRPDHQMHQYHQSMAQQAPLNMAPAAPPALIPTEHPPPPPPPPPQPPTNTTTPYAYEVVPQPVQGSEHLPTANPHSQSSQHIHQINSSLDSSVHDNSLTTYPPLPIVNLDDSRVMWADVPGPSGLNRTPPAQPDSDSSRDSTPEVPSIPSFSADEDSDSSDNLQTPDLSVSPAMFDESNSLLSSDPDDSSANPTPRDSSTDSSTASALHTLADAAAILADSPTPTDSSTVTTQHSTGQPMRLPVLINISDSDTDSHLSPSSIIDLTNSPTTSSSHPASSSHSNSYDYGVTASASDSSAQNVLSSRPATHHQEPPPAVHSDNRISAVLVPVIHQWNNTNEHQGLHPIQHYVPSDQVGVVQTAPVGVDDVTHMVHPSASLNSEAPVVGPVQIQQPYPVQEYSNRSAAVASWPAELPAPAHAVQRTLLYPPPQQTVSNAPHGDFWDTVIPSLDMTLQHSANSEN